MATVTKIVMDYNDIQPLADAVKTIGELDSSEKITLEDMIDIVSDVAENGTGGGSITTSLAELNAVNGGTAATTIEAAVDNTEVLANNQEVLIEQIISILDNKAIEEPASEIPTVEQATPTINISNNGLITASVTQAEGHVSGGTKNATLQLNTQGQKNIVPNKTTQTAVAKNVYTTGVVTVDPISDIYMEKNFTVVGGTTQPSNPTENTIWINTNTTITNYGFGQLPSENFVNNAANGAVWIITGTNAKSEISASKELDIMICPMTAIQVVNDSVEVMPMQAYIGGAWINTSVKTLFKDGDQCTAITGGWTTQYSCGEYGNGWDRCGVESDCLWTAMTIYQYEIRGGVVGTVNKVSLSGYTTIRIKGYISKSWRSEHVIGLSSSKTASLNPLAMYHFPGGWDPPTDYTGPFETTIEIPNGLDSAYIFLLSCCHERGDNYGITESMEVYEITLE